MPPHEPEPLIPPTLSAVAVVHGDPRRITGVLPAVGASQASDNTFGESSRTPVADTMPIAVIGMAGRYPGAADLAEFWRNLAEGRDSVTEIPAERWDHSLFFDPEKGRNGKTYGKWGGFLDGVDLFDPALFAISRKEAERMDPQERLTVRTVFESGDVNFDEYSCWPDTIDPSLLKAK